MIIITKHRKTSSAKEDSVKTRLCPNNTELLHQKWQQISIFTLKTPFPHTHTKTTTGSFRKPKLRLLKLESQTPVLSAKKVHKTWTVGPSRWNLTSALSRYITWHENDQTTGGSFGENSKKLIPSFSISNAISRFSEKQHSAGDYLRESVLRTLEVVLKANDG